MGPENAFGHYTSFNYFQSVDTPENKVFVERYKAKYGANSVTNAVMEAAYFETYFLAQAIEKVKSTDADALIFEGLPGQEFTAPQGKVRSTRRTITPGCGRELERPTNKGNSISSGPQTPVSGLILGVHRRPKQGPRLH